MGTESVNWLAVLVAALSSFVIGGIWYGPLFGKLWMSSAGVTEEQVNQGNKGKIFGLSFILQLVAAAVLAQFLGGNPTTVYALMVAGAVGVFWVAPAFGVVYLFEQRPLAHWMVNAGYHVVAFLAMGLILGVWP